ncbi:N,N-dimethylformamidase, small subunit [Methyloversatilis sp.]|uniref:N,N-dimethylformamidase, small subunit n=1 Tax=Methyloversatilis sp. TaxID=2569862 RepID=UPI003F704D63
MISIPKKGTPERDRLIRAHLECVQSMAGVAGFSVLKCATPGDTTVIGGGVHEDPLLKRVLLRMRGTSTKGKLVVICTRVDAEWRIGRLSGIRGVPPVFATDEVYTSEQDIQHAIFLMRLDEMPESDGFPEHYHEGYKRRDDNWPVT